MRVRGQTCKHSTLCPCDSFLCGRKCGVVWPVTSQATLALVSHQDSAFRTRLSCVPELGQDRDLVMDRSSLVDARITLSVQFEGRSVSLMMGFRAAEI
jgi:hypothetical protein